MQNNHQTLGSIKTNRINKAKAKAVLDNKKDSFFVVEEDTKVVNLDDGFYRGKITAVNVLEKKQMAVIDIELEGSDEVFVTFLRADITRYYAWRNFLGEHNITQPEQLMGLEVDFEILNKFYGGKCYSNIAEISLTEEADYPAPDDEELDDEDLDDDE